MKRIRYFKLMIGLLVFLTFVPYAQSVHADGVIGTQLWVGEYFNNTTRSGTPTFSRIDYDLNFNWGAGSPSASILADNFSARWTSNVSLTAGLYRFWIRADDQISVVVDGREVINTFSNNVVDQLVTGDITLGAGQHTMVIEYREYIGPAFVFFDFANLSTGETGPDFDNPTQATPTGQWVVNYYPNPNLIGDPVGIFGGQLPQGDWGYGAPLPSLPNDQWSARWQATLLFNGATYIMHAQADDGVRVYIDGRLIIDEWHTATATTYTTAQTLSAGLHNIVVEYYESGGTASLNFGYELSVNNTPPNTGDSTVLGTVTIATGRLNVRDEPNPFTGDILTRVSRGDTYQVLAFNQSQTWVQINANGVIGWVNAGYVAFNNTGTSTSDPTQYTVNAAPYTVNLRSGPGTQYTDIGNFQNGDTAQVIGRNADATWWQISYDGIVGWVVARYAKIDSWANIENIPITG